MPDIEVPRDREASFEPRLITKGQKRRDGLDEVKQWRERAPDAVYPVVIFDALRVKTPRERIAPLWRAPRRLSFRAIRPITEHPDIPTERRRAIRAGQ